MHLTKNRADRMEEFMKLCDTQFHPSFESMKVKSYFTKWLYGFLKQKAFEYRKDAIVSDAFEINLLGVSKKAQLSRNTTKKAFRELIKLGLIMIVKDEDRYPNECYKITLVNDKYISDWNRYEETFNFKFS
ncbi:MAG: hypothetical protein J0M18_08335 [Ignavibacteria bacterium]|nr:hypothetical protein [Ignavibacteria bacterium]